MLFFLEAKQMQHLVKMDAVENGLMAQSILGEKI
jgi:hypothetical protein